MAIHMEIQMPEDELLSPPITVTLQVKSTVRIKLNVFAIKPNQIPD